MTWKLATDVVWAVLAVLASMLVVAAHRSPRVSSLGRVMRRVLDRPAARGVVLVLWMWLGWHSFAR